MYKSKRKKKIPDREKVKDMIRELGELLPMTHEEILHRAVEKYYGHHINELRSPQIKKDVKLLLWKKQGSGCYYCREWMWLRDVTLDHKTPLSRDGANDVTNLCACCHRCNSLKGSMTEEEFRSLVIVPPLTSVPF